MSGEAFGEIHSRLLDVAGRIWADQSDPLDLEFAEHLKLVAEALRMKARVWSGDDLKGDDHPAVLKALGKSEEEEPFMLFLKKLDQWFRREGVKGFIGTCSELLRRMEACGDLFPVTEIYVLPHPSWMGKRLSQLQAKYPDRFSCVKREGSLVWTIGGPKP